MHTTITTVSGIEFDFANPVPEQVDLRDIAHALCRTPRFGGHTKSPWSVAQHSIAVSRLVEPKWRLQAILHDAAEAFLGDIPTPLKLALGEPCRHLFDQVEASIAKAFGYDATLAPSVKAADAIMLVTEGFYLLPGPPAWISKHPVSPLPLQDWHKLTEDLAELNPDRFFVEVVRAEGAVRRAQAKAADAAS